MLDIVRIVAGGCGIAGLLYLVRTLPPLIAARRSLSTRVGAATRYEAWRGGVGRGPDLLDRLEGELISTRLRRLVGVAIASLAGILIALFGPSA